ncbi:MAG: OsmC family protein [candidate division Zixibacteria bacterium]|nr:OsmC family protein [candidate division Zixibacteria bacterium]
MSAEIKTANIKWVEKMKFVGTGPSGRSIVMDTPESSGGDGSAVMPSELVLIGLGGCTGVDVVSMLAKMRVPLRDLKIDIEAEPVDAYPKTYKRIKIIYKFYGCDNHNKAKKAVGLSKEKYCSVSVILSKSAEMSHEIVFED